MALRQLLMALLGTMSDGSMWVVDSRKTKTFGVSFGKPKTNCGADRFWQRKTSRTQWQSKNPEPKQITSKPIKKDLTFKNTFTHKENQFWDGKLADIKGSQRTRSSREQTHSKPTEHLQSYSTIGVRQPEQVTCLCVQHHSAAGQNIEQDRVASTVGSGA